MILPNSRAEQIAFFEAHQGPWETHLAQLGLSQEDLDAMKALTLAARAAHDNAMSLRSQSKSATGQYYVAADKMRDLGAGLISTIKAYAEKTGDPNVYYLAELSPPAPPAPLPAPATPTNLRATIATDGTVTLDWNAERSGASSGVMFLIGRKRSTDPDWVVLTGVQETHYAEKLPGACQSVAYRVQAVRGGKNSGWTGGLDINLAGGAGQAGQQQAQAA